MVGNVNRIPQERLHKQALLAKKKGKAWDDCSVTHMWVWPHREC